VGIDIPEYAPSERAGPDPREPFWEVNATAAEYFRTFLWDDPNGEAAREYLAQRHVSKETADRYGLGLSPRDVTTFRTHMATLGFDDQRLLDAGLLVQPEGGEEVRPRFRNRLMFPILDAAGRYIAFGGRALGDVEPKYLNSPETPVFSKGKSLYALNWTRNDIRKADRVFVVEGYFDAIRLMDAGLNTVVAPLGTALTEAQAALLTRYTKNVYLLYDSDQAGLKATFRAGDELLKQGAAVRVITLPGGEDPDTFVQNNGAAALEAQVSQSVDIFERKIQILDRGGWFSELHKKRRALDRLLPTIRATRDAMLQDIYITHVSEKIGIAKQVLLRELGAGSPRDAAAADRMVDASPGIQQPRRTDRRHGDRRQREEEPAERDLLHVMLKYPERIETVAERAGPTQFRDAAYHRLFEALLTWDQSTGLEGLFESLDEEDGALVQTFLNEPDYPPFPDETMNGAIGMLEARSAKEWRDNMDAIGPIAPEDEKLRVAMEKRRKAGELLSSGQPPNRWFKKF
jgi:DNA primase